MIGVLLVVISGALRALGGWLAVPLVFSALVSGPRETEMACATAEFVSSHLHFQGERNQRSMMKLVF